MSYNIDSVKCLKLDAWMWADDIRLLRKKTEDLGIPEGCFLHEFKKSQIAPEITREPTKIELEAIGALEKTDPASAEKLAAKIGERTERAQVKLPNLWWYGEFSGTSYEDVLIKVVAPYIQGEVEAVFFWEGGDSVTGLHIKNGKVTEMDVEFVLKPKKEGKKDD